MKATINLELFIQNISPIPAINDVSTLIAEAFYQCLVLDEALQGECLLIQ
ncbi:hypothetical protein SAMN04490355_10895 [Pelosinus propionicus DSM 13327]|uniref:Uncharacterized protein n=1 Tax=Pelosinus propionicus DSM 13327 TaxID=1123291 RepID=A0A1I4QA22_9FIRM|nr:hypothetical protein SAMN04490355_10895 [Pelosinus propionicus DSM 13327]